MKSKATEALRVAQEVAAIRAALKKRGYSLRKRPKQPVWTITLQRGEIGRCYQLTYQPAPISSWVLYPQSSDSSRHTLLNIIQGVLTRQPAGIAGKVS
jgi:hypothetical protein